MLKFPLFTFAHTHIHTHSALLPPLLLFIYVCVCVLFYTEFASVKAFCLSWQVPMFVREGVCVCVCVRARVTLRVCKGGSHSERASNDTAHV